MSGFVMDRVARVVVGKTETFRHRFGGSPTHKGIIPQGNTQPLHLLYTFDTTDPLFPIRIPGARFIPLYYCFPYDAGSLGYRVVSDDEIEILQLNPNRVTQDFPYPDYPNEFPKTPVKLVPISYEQNKTIVHYLACDEYFLDDYVSDADHRFLRKCNYPFTQIGGIQRMWQGVPEIKCPNKKCENHKSGGFQNVLAVVWNEPVPRVFLWNEDGDEEDVQIIFQICSDCHAISVCNRCT